MKISTILVIVAAVIVLIIVFRVLFNPVEKLSTEIGTKDDLHKYIASLLSNGADDDFLIIKIADSQDFFQFKNYQNKLEIDFPLVTERQKSLESRVRQALIDQNLKIIENKGSGNTIFLDSYIDQSAPKASETVFKIFEAVFNINKNTKLDFQWTSFAINKS
jgi:hypothetical protein